MVFSFFLIIFSIAMSVFCEKEGYVDKNQDKAIFQVIEELQDKIKVMQNRIDKHEENERKLLEANKRFQVQIEEMENRIKSTRARKRQLEGVVAFTSYLDHLLTGVGKGQPILYNQIIVNEGNAYSPNTGVFRAPYAGVYLFSWSITARKEDPVDSYDVWSNLLVNGEHTVSAVAESRSNYDDNQGSNTAILTLAVGDEVWIAHISSYEYVFGDDVERSSSFAGVLLQEVEL